MEIHKDFLVLFQTISEPSNGYKPLWLNSWQTIASHGYVTESLKIRMIDSNYLYKLENKNKKQPWKHSEELTQPLLYAFDSSLQEDGDPRGGLP